MIIEYRDRDINVVHSTGKKAVQKSVRMCQEVLEFVESFNGDGFNDKFEKLVLYVKYSENDRKACIAALEENIDALKVKFQAGYEYLQQMDPLIRAAMITSQDMEGLKKRFQELV